MYPFTSFLFAAARHAFRPIPSVTSPPLVSNAHNALEPSLNMRCASFFARRMATAAGRRTMASSHGRHGQEYPHGMHFHVSPVHKNLALAYGTMLWLWVFWRAKQDGLALLVRPSVRPRVYVEFTCIHQYRNGRSLKRHTRYQCHCLLDLCIPYFYC